MLQTRTGKRTAHAALQIAVDMANEGLISKGQAVMRLKPDLIDQLLHPTLDPKAKKNVIAKGLPASPGAASGKVVFTADEAVRRSQDGEKVLLVRIETSPDDIHGLHAAQGVLTTRGGMTSHAAVVARGMGRPCVAGAGDVHVDYGASQFTVGDQRTCVRAGEIVTIDGITGEVILGEVPTVAPQLSGSFGTIMAWADDFRTMKVRANAETPADARTAKDFGAEGIGLVRTEHMFFEGGRIVAMREMILAADEADRKAALAKLLVMQREDITGFGIGDQSAWQMVQASSALKFGMWWKLQTIQGTRAKQAVQHACWNFGIDGDRPQGSQPHFAVPVQKVATCCKFVRGMAKSCGINCRTSRSSSGLWMACP